MPSLTTITLEAGKRLKQQDLLINHLQLGSLIIILRIQNRPILMSNNSQTKPVQWSWKILIESKKTIKTSLNFIINHQHLNFTIDNPLIFILETKFNAHLSLTSTINLQGIPITTLSNPKMELE